MKIKGSELINLAEEINFKTTHKAIPTVEKNSRMICKV